MNDQQPIIAIDLDNTIICPNTEIPYAGAVEAIRELKNRGWKIIIFTVRDNADEVKNILNSYHIPFDTINRNIPGRGTKSPKVYYDVLIDDRALPFDGNWSNMVANVERFRYQDGMGHDKRVLVKRLNSMTQKQEVIAEFGLDNQGKFGIISKCNHCSELMEDVLASRESEQLATLLALNGSRLWTEVHKRHTVKE